MTRSVIGTEVEPPEWLSRGMRRGMVTSSQADMGDIAEGTRVLTGTTMFTLEHRRRSDDGCLVPFGGGGHVSSAVLLNPPRDEITGNVALMYENLMYVGAPTASTEGDLPSMQVGSARSMWWVKSELDPGWYDNQGEAVEYQFNPQYLSNNAEIMALDVPNGTRLLGQMLRVDGLPYALTIGGRVPTDMGDPLSRWSISAYILPRSPHRSGLAAPEPIEYVDATVDMTHEQKVARLQQRFVSLTRATAEMAVEEDWCSNYEDACEAMGLAESDYTKEDEEEDVTYSVRVRLSYHISASAWDDILNSRFGGSHDIQDSTDIDSLVTLTVTQAGDFERDQHDWDEILDSAGYGDYDEYSVENWSSI